MRNINFCWQVNWQYFTERHGLGFFTVEEMTATFRQAGFAVTYDEEGLIGRGLYLAE